MSSGLSLDDELSLARSDQRRRARVRRARRKQVLRLKDQRYMLIADLRASRDRVRELEKMVVRIARLLFKAIDILHPNDVRGIKLMMEALK